MKTKLIALLCIVALFIPSYIAVASYAASKNAPVEEKTVSAVRITDAAGNKFELDREKAGDEKLIAAMIALSEGSKNVGSLPDEIKNSRYYTVTYDSYGIETEYKYYLSNVPADCYYTDNNGAVYRMSSERATEFLTSADTEPLSRCLYSGAVMPTLTVSGSEILPTSAAWSYTNYADLSIPLHDLVTSAAKNTYTMSSRLPFTFSSEPDSLIITLTEGGIPVYSGPYSELGVLDVTKNVEYDVTLDAIWADTPARRGGGNASYSFVAALQAPAVFYLGETSIQPGEFVVITGKNVIDLNAISFTSEPAINYTPKFFRDGANAVALVPISIDLPETSSYIFTVTSGDTTQNMTLTIEAKTFKSQVIDITSSDILKRRTEATVNEFLTNLSSVIGNTESVKYWDGTFAEAADASIRTGFGIYRTISGNKMQYRHEGVDYIVSRGYEPIAANAGKVVYVGEQTVSGLTVVIDHGFGLKSSYMHLSSASVAVGDIVAKGDKIGVVGSSGFTAGVGLHYGLSVFGVPVCPYSLWEDGVVMAE